MNSSASKAPPRPAALPASAREVQHTVLLVGAALLLGAVLQVFIPPGSQTLVAASALAGVLVLALSFVVPGRLRETLAGFRFTSTLLAVLAVMAMGGTLILQGQPPSFYAEKYPAAAPFITALRLDDIFHGLPFALVMALFVAGVVASASLRFPPKARNAGFFVCHLGLFTSLAGAAASTLLAQRGMVWIPEGGAERTFEVTKGTKTGQMADLGFDLRLDKFELKKYESEYRMGFYAAEMEKDEHGHLQQMVKLKTSFDACADGSACQKPDLARHVLPGGDTFQVKAWYPDYTQVATVTPAASGPAAVRVTVAGREQWLSDGEQFTTPDGTLVVSFGWQEPAAVEGTVGAVRITGATREVEVRSLGESTRQPLAAGAALLGGAIRVGELLEHGQRTFTHGTASSRWVKPAALVEWTVDGTSRQELVFASAPRWLSISPTSALRLEKRDGEAKAFTSQVTLRHADGSLESGVVSVNAPLTIAGWTFYQNSYNRLQDGTFATGLEAVYDPGVSWVFAGFALICAGVAYMFYVEPRLKGRKPTSTSTPAAGDAPAQAA